MINWKSILSSFNDKPTLLEWLKLVEKALKESVLTNVLTDTKDGKTAFTFKFEDGTEITTDYIQTQGVSITGIDTISDEVVGTQTITKLRVNLSNGEYEEVPVYAENGKVDFSEYPFIKTVKGETPFYFKPHTWYAVFGYNSLGSLTQLRYVNQSGSMDGYYGFVFGGNSEGTSDAIIYTADNRYVHMRNVDRVISTTDEKLSITLCEIDGLLNLIKGDKGDKGDTGATGPQGPAGPKGDKGDKGDTGQVIVDTCKIDGEVTKEVETFHIQAIANVFNKNITDFSSFLAATKNKTIVSNGYVALNLGDLANAKVYPIEMIKNIYQPNSQTYLIRIYYFMDQKNQAFLDVEESELANFTMVVEKW